MAHQFTLLSIVFFERCSLFFRWKKYGGLAFLARSPDLGELKVIFSPNNLLRTNQTPYGHQGQPDRPLFGGTSILNLDNTVNRLAKAKMRQFETSGYGSLTPLQISKGFTTLSLLQLRTREALLQYSPCDIRCIPSSPLQ